VTIVVTGATGFVGSALIERLAAMGEQVLAIGGPRSKRGVQADGIKWLPYEDNTIITAQLVADAQPTAVVYCANHYVLQHHINDIDPIIDANFRFGCLLLGVLAETPMHFVNLSSFFQQQGKDGTQPNSFYAATKQAFTNIVRWFADNSDLQTCDVMLFDTYGPGDERSKLIPGLLNCAMLGETMAIQTPSAEINLCFISDVISGIVDVVQRRIVGDWSIRAATNTNVFDVVRLTETVTGRKVVNEWGTAESLVSPILETRSPLPEWSPVVSLRQGIEVCWQAQQGKK
jgi:nucleoside-diphosphate-sugar epimerase